MAKKKEETDKIEDSKEKESFDLTKEISKINPYLQEGFHWFCIDKNVKTMADFKKYYKIYTGDEL